MVMTFPSVDAAMDARVKAPLLYVRIGGEVVDATEAHCRHGVDQLIGTCTVYCRAPRTAAMTINAEIEVEQGYPGAVRRTFHGFIPSDESVTDLGGHILRIDGVGWASRFTHPERAGIEIEGPVSLKDAFRALCLLRGIPTYHSDDTTYVDGSEILLGGNPQITGGHVRIDNKTSPADWLRRVPPLYGYRAFDSPDGAVRHARVSGIPPVSEAAVMHYEEGVNCHRLSLRRDRERMVTYWEVLGARYTDVDGGMVQIRSIPDAVPYAEELDPPGYIADTLSSQDIHTDIQAAGVRNALEVDRSELWEDVEWEAAGRPDLQPGDVVTVTGAHHGLTDRRVWLTQIDQATTSRGYLARMRGWAGAGTPLPAGDDSVTIDITIPGDGIAHLGNNTLSWYADPTPDGTELSIPIAVPFSDWTSLRLIGLAHGTNTYGTGNVANPTTGSVIELWQTQEGEEKRVGSLQLPTLDEEYARRRPYGSGDTYWAAFSLPIAGSLEQGSATLKLVAGTNPDGFDDYEVKNLQMVFAGVGQPSLPGEAS